MVVVVVIMSVVVVVVIVSMVVVIMSMVVMVVIVSMVVVIMSMVVMVMSMVVSTRFSCDAIFGMKDPRADQVSENRAIVARSGGFQNANDFKEVVVVDMAIFS